jgi:mono/diheme cytochrome c family protein
MTGLFRSVRLQAGGERPAKSGRYVCLLLAVLASQHVGAHKPITSKYTYTEDVYPIVSQHCGACHSSGGVAPMSLLTFDDARPWAESIRQELTAGHMPPWFGEPGFAGLRDPHKLSPRDLDVVLTWVTGGTPRGPTTAPGDSAKAQAVRNGWRRGRPGMTFQMPAAFNLPAGKSEDTQEFVLETARDRDRFIASADLLPGTPAIVHDAVIFVRSVDGARETILSTWLPGSTPVNAGVGVAFPWRSGEQLGLRIHYKKTWKFENKAASDRSTVGLYLANAPGREVRRLDLPASGTIVEEDSQALGIVALRNLAAPGDVEVRVEAVRPDGSRVPVAGFEARPGWDQRYWLARPLKLPKGTRLDVKTTGAAVSVLRLSIDIVRPM